MLRTSKPSVDDFIGSAKADSSAPTVAQKPTEGKGRGKAPSLYMPPADAADIRRYQVRMPEPVHREFRIEAARLGRGLADLILEGALEKAGREAGKRRGLTATALETFVEEWKAERTVAAYRAKGLPY